MLFWDKKEWTTLKFIIKVTSFVETTTCYSALIFTQTLTKDKGDHRFLWLTQAPYSETYWNPCIVIGTTKIFQSELLLWQFTCGLRRTSINICMRHEHTVHETYAFWDTKLMIFSFNKEIKLWLKKFLHLKTKCHIVVHGPILAICALKMVFLRLN